MKLPAPLIPGRLVRRYKRFLADIELMDGRQVIAHTPNTGSMRQCSDPGSEVLLSVTDNPQRKLPYTWELVWVNGHWVDINTHRANRVVAEALRNGNIPELSNCKVRPEFAFADSRLDFMLTRDAEQILVEVKNVTLCCQTRTACFPDAVTTRGQKHLKTLISAKENGWRAVAFFLVQRGEALAFSPAEEIDPVYARLLREASSAGVEIIAFQTLVTTTQNQVGHRLPVYL